jgi:hypothetical protein
MIDPNDAACSPATCLRAEAEDMRRRADHNAGSALGCPEPLRSDFLARSAAYLTLSARYEAAAQILDQHTDRTEAPFLGE